MANFLTKSAAGIMQLVAAIASSTGVADAGKIIETDANGLIDPSFLPAGIGSTIENLTAGEALTAGNFVYIDGTGNVLLADNTSITTEADGFVLTSYANGATDVVVYTSGQNTAVTATAGTTYFLDTAGGITATPPTFAVGSICQNLGTAVEANNLVFEYNPSVEYAAQ